MPHFHLHLVADETMLDEEGHDLPRLDEAIVMAIAGARELIADLIVSGRTVDLRHQIQIVDEIGRILHTISFADVITLVG